MSEPEIDELRQRWEADCTPESTLKLADALGRSGEPERALEVLTTGLETSPDHVETRVARGRFLLELDRVDESIRVLVPVVIDDPAHLAANRLLANAHAREGDLDRARDRLALFELLGGDTSEVGDPEGQDVPAVAAAAKGEPRTEPDSDGDSDPFVLLDWIEFDESRYAAALFTEGIFAGPAERDAAAAPGNDAPPAPSAEPTPTLTLGELYRSQGHHDEAIGIFRDILARQPGNVEAARALGELVKESSWPLSAEDLLGGGERGSGGGSREVLRRYRDRLRGRE